MSRRSTYLSLFRGVLHQLVLAETVVYHRYRKVVQEGPSNVVLSVKAPAKIGYTFEKV
jgi:hypothetical protein